MIKLPKENKPEIKSIKRLIAFSPSEYSKFVKVSKKLNMKLGPFMRASAHYVSDKGTNNYQEES